MLYLYLRFPRARQKAVWSEGWFHLTRTQQAVFGRTDVSFCGDGLKAGVKHAGGRKGASKVLSNGE